MKKLLFLFFCSLFFIGCNSEEKSNMSPNKSNDKTKITSEIIGSENPPIMEFDSEVFNFDTVAVGSTLNYTFKFKNTGSGPLVINSVNASCGCTVLKDWPKYLEVGGSGEIPIEFKPNYPGHTKKYISILANTKPATKRIYLEGYVSGI